MYKFVFLLKSAHYTICEHMSFFICAFFSVFFFVSAVRQKSLINEDINE